MSHLAVSTQIRKNIEVSSSGCNDLRVADINDANAGGCSACVSGSCMLGPYIPYLLLINSRWQFFYGRYLKKLSNQTQEAIGDMTKVCKGPYNIFYLVDFRQVASEALSALRTVQSYNAVPQEERKFHDKVSYVLTLARREAIASGIFFGSTGWSGNVTLLGLLGYGRSSESEQHRKWTENRTGGTLVSHGDISVGDLTSLLLYTVYVGNGLQMLT